MSKGSKPPPPPQVQEIQECQGGLGTCRKLGFCLSASEQKEEIASIDGHKHPRRPQSQFPAALGFPWNGNGDFSARLSPFCGWGFHEETKGVRGPSVGAPSAFPSGSPAFNSAPVSKVPHPLPSSPPTWESAKHQAFLYWSQLQVTKVNEGAGSHLWGSSRQTKVVKRTPTPWGRRRGILKLVGWWVTLPRSVSWILDFIVNLQQDTQLEQVRVGMQWGWGGLEVGHTHHTPCL